MTRNEISPKYVADLEKIIAKQHEEIERLKNQAAYLAGLKLVTEGEA
jgi:uncharacterized small protein (DUF1192 family)